MKENTTKIKSKQLTEKRVREIAREEADKIMTDHIECHIELASHNYSRKPFRP
jgi:hypothetical protein